MAYILSNTHNNNESMRSQYDSMNSIARPNTSANDAMNDHLLSASHFTYNTSDSNIGGNKITKKSTASSTSSSPEEKSTILSGMNITSGNNIDYNTTTTKTKQRRKSSFWDQPKASIFSSSMNLCNTVIGAGILALPNAMTQTGILYFNLNYIT